MPGVDNIARLLEEQFGGGAGRARRGAAVGRQSGITQAVWNRPQEGARSTRSGKACTTVSNTFHRGADGRPGDAGSSEADRARSGAGALRQLPHLAGHIAGEAPRLFLIYAAGNFIEATADTPFLQIGEHKYGKPILDRVIHFYTTIDHGVKAAMVSMDFTVRSNLTVGMPIHLLVYRTDSQLRGDLAQANYRGGSRFPDQPGGLERGAAAGLS